MNTQPKIQQATQSVDPGWDLSSAQQATAIINKFLAQHSLEFSVDVDVQAQAVKVVDIETKQTIRYMPAQEMHAISRALDKFQDV